MATLVQFKKAICNGLSSLIAPAVFTPTRDISFDTFGGSKKDVITQNMHIIATSRKTKEDTHNVSWVKTPTNSTQWSQLLRSIDDSDDLGGDVIMVTGATGDIATSTLKALVKDTHKDDSVSKSDKKPRRLIVFNTMGGAHGASLWAQNFTTAKDLFSAFASVDTRREKTAIHLSSIGEYLPSTKTDAEEDVDEHNEYGRVKRATTSYLMSIPQEMLPNLTILQVGYVLPTLIESEASSDFSKEHEYDVVQLANMHFHLIIGDGNQLIQPICKEDLIAGIIKCMDVQGRHIIPAVGKKIVTQKEMLEFYCNLLGRTFLPIHLPAGKGLMRLAQLAHKGHFAPYAVLYLQGPGMNLDSTAFEQALKSPARGMEVHADLPKDKPIVLAQSPLIEHTKEVAKKMVTHPRYAGQVISATVSVVKEKLCGV